ncbi:hypothetical protein AAF712_006865 [Marasmius tenuissimus]|uniref:Uncharacterized protein n=1 Tax=Marasmius tenuissimus TaxID=585030 RepID=A0ABR2ZY88_9AGAR
MAAITLAGTAGLLVCRSIHKIVRHRRTRAHDMEDLQANPSMDGSSDHRDVSSPTLSDSSDSSSSSDETLCGSSDNQQLMAPQTPRISLPEPSDGLLSPADYMPKALSTAHGTIIRHRTERALFLEGQLEEDANTSPTQHTSLPVRIGQKIANSLSSQKLGRLQGHREDEEHANSLRRIVNAFSSEIFYPVLTSPRMDNVDRYRHSLARGSILSERRYEGGYKQGIHTAAYKSHLLNTANQTSVKSLSISACSSRTVVVPVAPTHQPAGSLTIVVIPRSAVDHAPRFTPPGLDLPEPPRASAGGRTRSSGGAGGGKNGQENRLPEYALILGKTSDMPSKTVLARPYRGGRRSRDVLGLKVVNQ